MNKPHNEVFVFHQLAPREMEHAAVRRDNGSPVPGGNGLLVTGFHNRETFTRTCCESGIARGMPLFPWPRHTRRSGALRVWVSHRRKGNFCWIPIKSSVVFAI